MLIKTGWSSYWKSNPKGFNDIMYLATSNFCKNLKKAIPFLPTDRLLDIGCGPGFFIDKINTDVQYCCGVDISDKYIEICNHNFRQYKNIDFFVSEAYSNDYYKKIIIEKDINRIIMLSVIQYYQNTKQIDELLLSFKQINYGKEFSLLIADIIPTNHSFIADMKSIIKYALKNGYIFKFFKFIFFVLFSDYRKTKKVGLLNVDPIYFQKFGEENSLEVKIIKNLTIHSSRYSVLINF